MRRQSLRALTSSGVPQRWPGQHHGRGGTRITPGGDSNLAEERERSTSQHKRQKQRNIWQSVTMSVEGY